MAYNYNLILNEYKQNTENLMADYLKLKEKAGNLCILQAKLQTRIGHLLVCLVIYTCIIFNFTK